LSLLHDSSSARCHVPLSPSSPAAEWHPGAQNATDYGYIGHSQWQY